MIAIAMCVLMCQFVSELVDEKSQGRSENVGKDAIVLSSDDSNQGIHFRVFKY